MVQQMDMTKDWNGRLSENPVREKLTHGSIGELERQVTADRQVRFKVEEHKMLNGVRVIDWTHWIFGPAATAWLADLGADVIHVELPNQGDPLRGLVMTRGVKLGLPNGRHSSFEVINRNKRSLALDVTREKGRQILCNLVAKSDVFVTNYRRNVAARLGLDYETLRKHNGQLIYASGTAFGEEGPDADLPGMEMLGLARSGIMMSSGEEGMPPVQMAVGVGDYTAGMVLTLGIVAALLCRERLGIGQKVTTSLLAAMIAPQSTAITCELLTGQRTVRFNRQKSTVSPLYNHFRCKDGKWLALAITKHEKDWPTLCRQLGVPELESDPKYATHEKMLANSAELVALLDSIFATRNSDEWEQRFIQGGLLAARIATISDLATDAQVLANKYITEWDHPVLGKVKMPGFPIKWSETPAKFWRAAPELGQDTEDILIELGGCSWDEISQLKDDHVIV